MGLIDPNTSHYAVCHPFNSTPTTAQMKTVCAIGTNPTSIFTDGADSEDTGANCEDTTATPISVSPTPAGTGDDYSAAVCKTPSKYLPNHKPAGMEGSTCDDFAQGLTTTPNCSTTAEVVPSMTYKAA